MLLPSPSMLYAIVNWYESLYGLKILKFETCFKFNTHNTQLADITDVYKYITCEIPQTNIKTVYRIEWTA